MPYSYGDYIEYIGKINKLEKNLMETLNSDIRFVGISIQLYQEIQDDYSPTREHPSAINCYCKKIQNEKKIECNKFDIDAKEYLLYNLYNKTIDYSKQTNPLLCNCHADVTNLLFVFNPKEVSTYRDYEYDNKNVNIYIFIGHFLLNEHPFEKFYNNEIESFDKIDGYNYKNINAFTPISLKEKKYEKDKYNLGNKEDEIREIECSGIISNVSTTKLLEVKISIQNKLLDFYTKNDYIYIDNDAREIKVQDKLIKIDNTPSLQVISKNLQEIDKQIKKFESISVQNKRRFIEIRNEIAKKIKNVKAQLFPIREKIKANNDENNFSDDVIKDIDNALQTEKILYIHNWLIKGLEGEVGLEDWFIKYDEIKGS